MHEIELVVFDLAGTTVRDDGQVPEAFTAALAEHGVTVGPEVIRGVRGASKREAIVGLMPAGAARGEQAELAYASFRHHLALRYADTEAVADDEAAYRSTATTVMKIPVKLVPPVRALLAKRRAS